MNQSTFFPVSVSGGFWTGSGAVVDLLAEHSDCVVVPGEFTVFSHGDMFEELLTEPDQRPRTFSKDFDSIWRFKEINRYEIPKIKSAARLLSAELGYYPLWLFTRREGMHMRFGPDYKDATTTLISLLKQVQDLDEVALQAAFFQVLHTAAEASLGGSKASVGVFDQMVAPPHAVSSWRFLSDLRIICVDRDWRDQYVEVRNEIKRMNSVKMLLGMKAFGMELTDADKDPVHFFIRLRQCIDKVKQHQTEKGDERIMWLDFEDIVKNPTTVAQRIFDFLGLDPAKWQSGTILDVSRSIQNIGKWKKSTYLDEIAHIQRVISAPSNDNISSGRTTNEA